jgi:hypothetical protein
MSGDLAQWGWSAGPSATDEPYRAQREKLPLALQDRNHAVRYRNIWVRELAEE